MKHQFIVGLLATLVTASPVPVEDSLAAVPVENALVERQGVGSTANELEQGACRDVTYIFARGSTEPGNLGISVGPALCNSLKTRYGSDRVACQGVGGPYIADLGSNALPLGTTTAAIREAQRLFTLAATKCPNTKIVASGYSQGAAVMTSAVGTSSVKDQIVGAVLFGDTRNLQTAGSIPGYSRLDTLIICLPGDGVCDGTLIVTAAHLAYVPTVPTASSFLQRKIGL